jgi:hypothetical protein
MDTMSHRYAWIIGESWTLRELDNDIDNQPCDNTRICEFNFALVLLILVGLGADHAFLMLVLK